MDSTAAATARQMALGWDAAICLAAVMSLTWTSLRWAAEASSWRSGGVMPAAKSASAEAGRSRGEGWPDRERRISWSMAFGPDVWWQRGSAAVLGCHLEGPGGTDVAWTPCHTFWRPPS